jgi:hypothetical protein
MSRYVEADTDLYDMMHAVKRRYHRRLQEIDLAITILLAYGQEGEPALKAHGFPAAALIKRTSHRDRVAGHADAILIVDGDHLDTWDHATVAGLVDHELTHLEPVIKDGRVQRDDAERPKLTLRPHDHQLGIFLEVIQRHGMQCLDCRLSSRCHEACAEAVRARFAGAAADLGQTAPDSHRTEGP